MIKGEKASHWNLLKKAFYLSRKFSFENLDLVWRWVYCVDWPNLYVLSYLMINLIKRSLVYSHWRNAALNIDVVFLSYSTIQIMKSEESEDAVDSYYVKFITGHTFLKGLHFQENISSSVISDILIC